MPDLIESQSKCRYLAKEIEGNVAISIRNNSCLLNPGLFYIACLKVKYLNNFFFVTKLINLIFNC